MSSQARKQADKSAVQKQIAVEEEQGGKACAQRGVPQHQSELGTENGGGARSAVFPSRPDAVCAQRIEQIFQ